MHSLTDNINIIQALAPQTIQGSALDSGDLDTQGAETLAIALLVGDIADELGATQRIDVKIEHAEDDGTGAPDAYEACADADVLNASGLVAGKFLSIDAAGKAESRHVVGYRGGRRFVRVTATPVGLVTGGPVAMLALAGNLSQRPADNA